MFEDALAFAARKHKGQVDKGNVPFILHPLTLAMKFNNDDLRAIAVLHDVLEDTDATVEDLEQIGMSETVVNAVIALTRNMNESYRTYIKRVKKDPFARAVKIEDLNHNLQRDRLHDPAVRAFLEKGRPQYYEALAMLDHRSTEE